jgi:RNA polymerase-binding transcription factor DksA
MPAHLYIGDQSRNVLDSVERGTHREARKTHCHKGHEFNEVNTRIGKDGFRYCKPCNREWQAARRTRV